MPEGFVVYFLCRKSDFVLQVPKVYWNLSTSRVLTMEYVEGGQINDLAYIRSNDIDRYEVADKLSQLYSQMIFIHGFVHSDPHPGNILVKKTPKGVDIVLLDHGLYAVSFNTINLNISNETTVVTAVEQNPGYVGAAVYLWRPTLLSRIGSGYLD
jgi:Predicted unusual protein kinase